MILINKFKTLFRIILETSHLIFFLPLALIILLIQPLYLIRLGFISSSRVGNFFIIPEIHLAEKKEKIIISNNKGKDFFYFDKDISNSFIAKKIRENLNILPFYFLMPIYKNFIFFSRYFIFIKKHIIKNHNYIRDSKNLLEKHSPIITLNSDEINAAISILSLLNPQKKKIAIFFIRDEAYLNFLYPKTNWENDNLRNIELNKFIKSIKFLADNDYIVFRMGKNMKNKLNLDHPNVVDYAFSNYRSDFMDFYLASNCDICISTDTGMDIISDVHKVPMGIIQFPISWIRSQRPNVLTLPRLIKNKTTDKILTLNEIFKNKVASNRDNRILINKNLELVDFDEDEILLFVKEVYERKQGIFTEDRIDKSNQKKFWDVFLNKIKDDPNSKNHDGNYKAKISSQFLRKNSWFLS